VLAPDATRLVTAINVAERRVEVELWDLPGTFRHPLGTYDNEFVGACFSPTGKHLVVAPAYPDASGGMLRIWDVQGAKPIRLAEFRGPDRLHRIKFAPNGERFVISGRAPGELILHDIIQNTTASLGASTGSWVISLAFSSDGGALVAATPTGQVRFLKVPTGEELGTLNLDEQVSVVELTAGDDTLITASWDGPVRLWPIASVDESPQ
jgi:WD40 repeat protein